MEAVNVIFQVLYYAVFILSICFVIIKYAKAEKPTSRYAVTLDKRTLIYIIVIVIASRLVLLLLSWGATHLAGYGKTLLGTWFHWDAHQYVAIANEGYYSVDEGWIRIVFFPLYSAVISLFKLIFVNDVISAMLVSWTCLCGACIYLYKLVLLDGDKKAANRAVKYLLIFPVTVFLGAPFTESMFLLLSFGCLYHARIGQFARACILGGLAALTRNVGVLLAVPVLIEMLLAHDVIPRYFKQDLRNNLKKSAKDLSYLLIIPVGTGIYLLINHMILGDAFGFLDIQNAKWSQGLGSYANTLSVTLGQILSPDNILRNKLTLWISQFVVLLIGGLTLPVICRKMRMSYGAYAIVYLFIVFAPTWLLSGFRYYMGLAVLFPALAWLTEYKWADISMTIVFSLLMCAYTFSFSLQWQII